MENMKSLADQLREELVKPNNKKLIAPDITASPAVLITGSEKSERKSKIKKIESAVMTLITEYDNSGNKNLVHTRFDANTVRLMNQFKMATNVDVTKLVAFAVKHLFDTSPELKEIIKQFIQTTDL